MFGPWQKSYLISIDRAESDEFHPGFRLFLQRPLAEMPAKKIPGLEITMVDSGVEIKISPRKYMIYEAGSDYRPGSNKAFEDYCRLVNKTFPDLDEAFRHILNKAFIGLPHSKAKQAIIEEYDAYLRENKLKSRFTPKITYATEADHEKKTFSLILYQAATDLEFHMNGRDKNAGFELQKFGENDFQDGRRVMINICIDPDDHSFLFGDDQSTAVNYIDKELDLAFRKAVAKAHEPCSAISLADLDEILKTYNQFLKDHQLKSHCNDKKATPCVPRTHGNAF